MSLLDDAFLPLARATKNNALLEREFVQQTRDFDKGGVQESYSWRIVHVARALAGELIDKKGALDKKALFAAIETIEEKAHSLGPDRHHDLDRTVHLKRLLHLLHDDPAYLYALKRISLPPSHQIAQRLIRESLLLPPNAPLTDAHARQAVLSALFTFLRQNVGSCFATAPAILIQQGQPLAFLADMDALLATGRLTRVIEGEEFSVPLSSSWGSGQLFAPIRESDLSQLARAPGLQAALSAAGVLDPKGKRIEQLEALLAPFAQRLATPFSPLCVHTLLEEILLAHFDVRKKEVTAYLEKGSALLPPRIPSAQEGVCARFLEKFEAAKNAFKALTDHALLKSWEFTLASLAETHGEFARWNLYASLGLHPDEEGGIGSALRTLLQEKIDALNQEVEAHQSKYDHLFAQAKYLEGRMRRASEREIGWVTADYHMRKQEINRLLAERDEAYEKARRLSSFLPFFLTFCQERFKAHFQEIYDPQMHSESLSPYDDSPAGFRLLYKHGRANTALWTAIYTGGEFIEALAAFFTAIESEVRSMNEAKGLEREISAFISTLLQLVKRPDFLEKAQSRLRAAYGDQKREPWAYVSGGTMATLVRCYYTLPSAPKEVERWVESPTELLAFLLDTLKELPHSTQKMLKKHPERGMLAFSPTHAYIVKPMYSLFHTGWESDEYTYTWIRDHLIHPGEDFLDERRLDAREIAFFVDKLLAFIPKGYRPIVKEALKALPSSLYPFDLRAAIKKILSYEKWLSPEGLQLVCDEIDALLYAHLPLFPDFQVHEKLSALFLEMEEIDQRMTEKLIEKGKKIDFGRYHLFSAQDLCDVAKSLLISQLQTTRTRVPYHHRIVHTLQKLGFRAPAPLIFGDTNWVKKRFAFVVNPGSRALELWCVDSCGGTGRSLSIWKRYLDGSEKKNWGLYTHPEQYGEY